MATLARVNYDLAPEVSVAEAVQILEQTLASGVAAFVVKQAGGNLAEGIMRTGLEDYLRANGYTGDIRQTVDFTYKAHNVLPPDYKQLPRPVGDSWYFQGITPLHADQAPSLPGTKISLNHTRAGVAELLLHHAMVDTTDPNWDSTGQWDALDKATGDLLWEESVDPDLMSYEGIKAVAEAGDMWVFDASLLHLGKSIVTPRTSETMFFDKIQV